MAQVTWEAVAAVLALLVAVCSISAFVLGRKQAASDNGKKEGQNNANLLSLTTSMEKVEKSLEKLSDKIDTSNKEMSAKIDCANKEREQEYRDMLVKATTLESSYKSLHTTK
jgi:hypothetical protein